ncbi:MAG TPA: SseB family protein [Streptosporangiaceae bacterium]
MRSLHAAEPQFPGDDGAADPAVLAALTAYGAGRGSEYAALNALASSRLLVPVVALLTEEADEDIEADDSADVPGTGLRREKTTEMAMPTLIGRDGRSAVLAFTSLDALTRWRPDARPVAMPAARAWQAGAEEASAVVIDVAGPVPVTVEGARLAALAAGRPAPLPHQDPDVLVALHRALGSEPLIVQASLTTPDQRAGWEHGPRPEDLPDLAARSNADLGALGLDLPGTGNPSQTGAVPDSTGPDTASRHNASQNGAGHDSAARYSAARGSAARDSAAQDSADGDSAAGGNATGASAIGASAKEVGTAGADAVKTSVAGTSAIGDGAAAGGAGSGSAGHDALGPDAAAQDTAAEDTAAQDTADLALQVTLADGCDPAAATAAVRRVAEALLTATGGRLRRGMEISVAPPRRAARPR